MSRSDKSHKSFSKIQMTKEFQPGSVYVLILWLDVTVKQFCWISFVAHWHYSFGRSVFGCSSCAVPGFSFQIDAEELKMCTKIAEKV